MKKLQKRSLRSFAKTIEENLANKSDLRATESNLTKYIESVRTELKKNIEILGTELKKDIAESQASAIRWIAGMLIAQTALIATLVKLL